MTAFLSTTTFWLCLAIQISSNFAVTPDIQTTIFKGVPENWAGSIGIDPFEKIGQKYYFIDPNQTVNWFEAAHECRRRNAQLASIETAQELTALTEYFKQKNWNLFIWTSGNDLATEGKYYWMGTGQPISYIRWSKHEPNNSAGNENCLHLKLEDGIYQMNDRSCLIAMNFLCEASTPRTIAFTIW